MSEDVEIDPLIPIDRVAKESGLASSALRYYERCELIEQGHRIGGRRHYPASIVKRLTVIKICRAVGFSLTEISDLLDGPVGEDGDARRALLSARREEISRQIALLGALRESLDAALSCGCDELVACTEMSPQGELANRTDLARQAGVIGVRGSLV